MNFPVPIGIIGADRYAQAIVDHGAPLPGARVARWAASPCGRDHDAATALAKRIDAPFSPDWDAVARDPSLPGVLVLSRDPGKVAAVEVALSAGKVVLCPVPAVTRGEDLDRLAAAEKRGGGALLSAGALRHTPAGQSALRMAAGGELGTLHSAYAAARFPSDDHARGRPPILDEAGWEIFDFLLAVVPAPVQRVQAQTAALFGLEAEDTAVLIVRFENDVIATIECSRCLPPSIPTTVMGDVEVELIGSQQAIRLDPWATSLGLFGAGAARCPWVDDPVISMVRGVVNAVAGEAERVDATVHLRRAVALMDAVR
jgi:predicted dehydrogenase